MSSAKFLGPLGFKKLWQSLGDDLGRVFNMSDAGLRRMLTPQSVCGIREQADNFADSLDFMRRQIEHAAKCGGQIITLDDPR
ncbi:MAG: hypothetical protein QGD94_05085, partial [Planctomycetia bacterium]|nr:hypothetical protein [Planctomycetia bacterium]